jgi:uncharacterized protein
MSGSDLVAAGSRADRVAAASRADLIVHLARFAGALRDRNVRVSFSDEADALEALTLSDLSDSAEVRRALAIALKIRPRDAGVFAELFASWWTARAHGAPEVPPVPRPPREAGRMRRFGGGSAPRLVEAEVETPQGDTPGYSAEALLRRRPFEQCTEAELRAMERLLERMAVRLATKRSRRLVPTRGPGRFDPRRSFRNAVATDGEFLRLARRTRAIEEPRLVVLVDTSGSMDPHTRFLLSFLLAVKKVAHRTEIFAFNTSLHRLTPSIAPNRVASTLARIAAEVPDWSGGTRIGESLRDFVNLYLDETVDARTAVVIVSDGLDRGDTSALTAAMRAIRARARTVIWLNPLLGDSRYEPTARGMAAALPYVDVFAPAHNLESLERLLPLLSAA